MSYIKSNIILSLIESKNRMYTSKLCDAQNYLAVAEREFIEPKEQFLIEKAQRTLGRYEGRLLAYHDIERYIKEQERRIKK